MAWLSQLTKDLGLKLFSLCVALLLFAFVSVENSTPIEADFRLEYRLADDMMLVGDAPLVVHTTLRGPWAAFRSLDPADLEPVVLALQDAGPGRLRHFVDLGAIHPPTGMRALSVRPAELEVELDRRVIREVTVQADVAQSPAFGFEVMDVRLAPARVRVSGPASKMQALDHVNTRTIDISGREDDLDLEVDLRPPSPPLRLLDKRVTAFVEIAEEVRQRTFVEVPVLLRGAMPLCQASPKEVSVTLKGPRKVIERLAAATMAVEVDVSRETAAGFVSLNKAVSFAHPLVDRTQLVGTMPRVEVTCPSKRSARRRP